VPHARVRFNFMIILVSSGIGPAGD
jgi:hypothetical protein